MCNESFYFGLHPSSAQLLEMIKHQWRFIFVASKIHECFSWWWKILSCCNRMTLYQIFLLTHFFYRCFFIIIFVIIFLVAILFSLLVVYLFGCHLCGEINIKLQKSSEKIIAASKNNKVVEKMIKGQKYEADRYSLSQ